MADTTSKRILLALTPLLLGVTVIDVRAEGTGERCDQLAAHPADPTKGPNIAGVATGEIDIDAAILACSVAIETNPANPRYHYQLGRAYFDKKAYDNAFKQFRIAADGNLAIAQAALGYLYDSGLGTPRDFARGLELATEAADAGIPFAAHNLGVTFRDSKDVPADYAKSLAYFRKAASLGYSQSLVDIGFAYDKGYSVDVDYAEAMRWYRLAANKDIAEGFNNLGDLYEQGHGVAQDYAEALRWYRKAQQQDYALAYMNVANLAEKGQGMASDPKMAADLVFKAFELGGASDDAFNRDYLVEDFKGTEFWKQFQTRLATAGHYRGKIDGQLSEETKAALEHIVDK
jgi:TPR repeat protein